MGIGIPWNSKYRAYLKIFFGLIVAILSFFFAFSPLKRLRVALSFLYVEKQGVLLIFNLFSSRGLEKGLEARFENYETPLFKLPLSSFSSLLPFKPP